MNSVRTVAGCVALSAMIAPTVAMTMPAIAHATPPIGISAVTLSKQTVNGKEYITIAPTEAPAGTPTRARSTAANALANGQWWVMANQRGGTGPNALLGRSRMIAPDGAVIAEAPRWDGDGDDTHLLVASLDLSAAVADAEQEAGALWASGTTSVSR